MVRFRRTRRRIKEIVIAPTHETLAKLPEEWMIVRLLRVGAITQEHERAAREIDQVWRAIMRGLFRTQKLMSASRGNSDATDAMSEYEAACHAQHYLPWARQEANVLLSRWPKVTRFDLTLAVCTTDRSPLSLDAPGKGVPSALDHLRMSLDRYARMPRLDFSVAS